MPQQIIHIHPSAPPKPAFGEECNGCGVCCLAEPCPIGQIVSRRRHGACVAVIWSKSQSRYRCGMVDNPRARLPWLPGWMLPAVKRLALRWIASAKGCDCDLGVSRH
jgi:hypothetical protein